MKTLGLALAAILLGSAVSAAAGENEAVESAELAKALAGREAGAPVRCINYSSVRSTRIIEGVGLLYEVGSTVYLNRPYGHERLDRWDVPVTEIRGGSICAREAVKLMDQSLRGLSGIVFLGEFIPYRKPR